MSSQQTGPSPYPGLLGYYPSFNVEAFFAAAFLLTSLLHLIQLLQHRTWCFIPFVIGGYFEAAGFGARVILAKQTPNWELLPCKLQTLFLLLAPTLFANSINMLLARIVRLTHGESFSVVPVGWLTKIFLGGDILSFILQASGGGILAKAQTAEAREQASHLIIGGLVIQLVMFFVFIVVAVNFHLKISKNPTEVTKGLNANWIKLLLVMISSSLLIFVRSVFRILEYVGGSDNDLSKREIYTIVLDSVLMLICMALFNLLHPSKALNNRRSRRITQSEILIEKPNVDFKAEEP